MSKGTFHNLTYFEPETKTSQKTGNNFTLLHIGDAEEFQKHSFMVADSVKQKLGQFAKGDIVDVTVDLQTQGFNQRLSVVDINPSKK